jgi:hypothetical protein
MLSSERAKREELFEKEGLDLGYCVKLKWKYIIWRF